MVTQSFSRPTNWQDFEIFMKDFFNEKYGNGFDRYGREGQAQHGIDILGSHDGKNIGIQCKRYEESLTIGKIKKEAIKADKGPINLQEYIFATTDKRDAKIQKDLLQLNSDREKNSLTKIQIMFWETIEDEINSNIKIQEKYYNAIQSKIDPEYKYNHIIKNFKIAFTRPAFFTHFSCEGDIDELLKALKKTQEFLKTGRLRSNDDNYILGTLSYSDLKYDEDRMDGDSIYRILQETRNLVQTGLKNGSIRCHERFYCADADITNRINGKRKEIFELVNKILHRYGETGLRLPY